MALRGMTNLSEDGEALSKATWRCWLAGKLDSPLARNTLWALGGSGTRLLIQAIYFLIIARCLGPGQYGAFIAATALTAVMSPFVGLGHGILLIKNVSRDRRLFAEYWGNGLMMTLVSGSVLTFLAMGVCRLVLPRSIPMMVIALIKRSVECRGELDPTRRHCRFGPRSFSSRRFGLVSGLSGRINRGRTGRRCLGHVQSGKTHARTSTHLGRSHRGPLFFGQPIGNDDL